MFEQGSLSLVIVLAVVVLPVIAYVAFREAANIARRRRRAKISAESPKLAALRTLNAQFEFHQGLSKVFTRPLNSKGQFDRFDPLECLLSILVESPEEFDEWVAEADENAAMLEEYEEGLRSLPGRSYPRVSWALVEDELFDHELLKPETKPSITIAWSYESPAGRNCYRDAEVFSLEEVRGLLRESRKVAKDRGVRQAQIQRERALMTDSLRYDVLRRDNFTCQICGSTARDGVRLEVDHIVPVSRGGRTEMDNLQTLCERCNRGKLDKV